MALEITTPNVSAVEHNTQFPRYDDGQQPEWYDSEIPVGHCNWIDLGNHHITSNSVQPSSPTPPPSPITPRNQCPIINVSRMIPPFCGLATEHDCHYDSDIIGCGGRSTYIGPANGYDNDGNDGCCCGSDDIGCSGSVYGYANDGNDCKGGNDGNGGCCCGSDDIGCSDSVYGNYIYNHNYSDPTTPITYHITAFPPSTQTQSTQTQPIQDESVGESEVGDADADADADGESVQCNAVGLDGTPFPRRLLTDLGYSTNSDYPEVISPDEFALIQTHRDAMEAMEGCCEGCKCKEDRIGHASGVWYHFTISPDEYDIIQKHRLRLQQEQQQIHNHQQQQQHHVENGEDEGEGEGPMLHWGEEAEPMLHWGSMGDRLGGDDLSHIDLAPTVSYPNKTGYTEYLGLLQGCEQTGATGAIAGAIVGATEGGAGVVADDADGYGCDMTYTNPLLTSPNSNPLGFHIVHERLTDYLDDDNDCTVYSDEEYSDDDDCCDKEGGYTGENESDWF